MDEVERLRLMLELQTQKVQRLSMPTPYVRSSEVAFQWSPIESERLEQQRRVKEIFGEPYPNAFEDWQFLNTLLSFAEHGIRKTKEEYGNKITTDLTDHLNKI